MDDDVIEISSDSDGETYVDRRALFQPIVAHVVDALGGYEGDVYRLGDEVNGCLKDLKKLWRKDDTDDERTIARIFWETRVLPNDLIPILLETAGKGHVEDKRAISCADLMTAMTWPIDMAEELKELDEELDKGTDYTQLLQSHLHYKAAILRPGVMKALFGIVLPPLAKSSKERTERDGQIINVVLHLIRNLAFIKDLPPNMHLSSDQAELSGLQSKLVRALSSTHFIHLLLTIASNVTNDPLFTQWNTLILEIFYLLLRGVKPSALTEDQKKQPADKLHSLLAAEERRKREISRAASTRHSRFGTTIAVKLKPNDKTADNQTPEASNAGSSKAFVLHRQQALNQDAGSIWDITKRHRAKKATTADELTLQDNLSVEAKSILQNMATDFVEACFNPFLAGLLKDIRSERPKIVEKDHLRLLYVTKWFLDYFLSRREMYKDKPDDLAKWEFGLIAEVTEREWIVWVLKRMREAVEEKPKLWTELQAGIECLTQLLLLIDSMSSTELGDSTLQEAAEILQQQLVYNGEVLDITLDSLRAYKPATQSLAYLDSSVHMAYVLLRMLERWSKKKGDVYVRKKKTKRRKKKGMSEEDGILDVEEMEVEEGNDQEIIETMFTFEAFEGKFANAEVTQTLLLYLSGYKDFPSSENMRRVVSLLHRQAVRAKAEGLFFKVSTLNLFKVLLADQKSFPRDQPHKDLVNLINFILRRFFKALAEDSFLAIEAFFPKNRGHWKQFSTWEPAKKTDARTEKTIEDTRFPPEVRVKKGYSASQQLGIAIAALVDAGQKDLVEWVVNILTIVLGQRKRIFEEIDAKNDDDDTEDAKADTGMPSAEAMSKMTDYLVPYLSDEHADAATKTAELKLLFRLSKFYVLDEDADELEWYIPAAILPSELEATRNTIQQFLENPIDLEGKKASQLLSKKSRRRRKVRPPDSDAEDDALDEEEPAQRKKKERKKKEKEQYKSAQFIEDSDIESGDLEAFLAEEHRKREKAALAAANAGLAIDSVAARPTGMRSTGTKKRRRNASEKDGSKKKKRKGDKPTPTDDPMDDADESMGGVDADDSNAPVELDRPRPKPRPRPKTKTASPEAAPDDDSGPAEVPRSPPEVSSHDGRDLSVPPTGANGGAKGPRKGRLIISDEEEE